MGVWIWLLWVRQSRDDRAGVVCGALVWTQVQISAPFVQCYTSLFSPSVSNRLSEWLLEQSFCSLIKIIHSNNHYKSFGSGRQSWRSHFCWVNAGWDWTHYEYSIIQWIQVSIKLSNQLNMSMRWCLVPLRRTPPATSWKERLLVGAVTAPKRAFSLQLQLWQWFSGGVSCSWGTDSFTENSERQFTIKFWLICVRLIKCANINTCCWCLNNIKWWTDVFLQRWWFGCKMSLLGHN